MLRQREEKKIFYLRRIITAQPEKHSELIQFRHLQQFTFDP